MGKNILEKVRKLNWILQEAPKGEFSFNELCEILGELTDSNVYLINIRGKVLGHYYKIEEDTSIVRNEESGFHFIPYEYNQKALKIEETKSNVVGEEVLGLFVNEEKTKEKYHTLIPVLGHGKRCGTLLLTRYNPAYEVEEIALGEIGATAFGIEIQRRKNTEEEEIKRSDEAAKMALSTLSYSETEAVIKIFEELDGEEGLLVASRVADRSGITRSVIVNALRKLESAGAIESRSLGMKGTHIKIINRKLFELL